MTTPVKVINKQVGVLKVSWMAVKNVLVKFRTVIVYYGSWRLFKMSQKDLKGVSRGLV